VGRPAQLSQQPEWEPALRSAVSTRSAVTRLAGSLAVTNLPDSNLTDSNLTASNLTASNLTVSNLPASTWPARRPAAGANIDSHTFTLGPAGWRQ
jgi:uncharacterized protein YjbI with pentapeptide repeats